MSAADPDAIYVALINQPSRLKTRRRLTYRCAKDRCLLLDAIEVGDTIVLHQKRFKQSDLINQLRSSESGRAKNTFDGDRHWKPRSYFLSESALSWTGTRGSGQSIQCDHVGVRRMPDRLDHHLDTMLTADDFEADWRAGHSEILVRPDGTRFAVR